MKPGMKESLVGIQILRFAAAMLVAVMHLTQAYSIYISGEGGGRYWSQGSAGVDIFFVISGLVMGLSTPAPAATAAARWQQARIFAGRRLLRVVPLYWFYTLLKVALVLAMPALAQRYTLAPGHFMASLFFVPAVSPWGLVQPTLPVGWTLNFEMLFYALFALAIALGTPRLVFVLLSFGLIYLGQAWLPDSVVLGFWGQSLLFEFVLGLGIAMAWRRLRQNVPEAGLLALVLGGVLMFGLPWQPSDDRLGSWGLAAALIVAGAVWLEPWTQRLPAARALGFLGDASYSIYLSHTFVVPASMQAARYLGWQNSVLLLPGAALLVVLTGCLSHLWLERPMTRALKRVWLRDPARVPVGGAAERPAAACPNNVVQPPESSHAKP